MKKTVLQNYARLIARKGVNVQKGQDVVIRADLDQPEFVKMVAEECYKAGARLVCRLVISAGDKGDIPSLQDLRSFKG